MTSWTTPRTWTSEVLTSTLANTHLRDNLNHLSEQISRTGWSSFTPSWSGVTVGNGTNAGYKAYAGKTTILRVEFTLGSTSAITGSVILTLPDTSVTHILRHPLGLVTFEDNGTNYYEGIMDWASTTTAVAAYFQVTGSIITRTALSSTAPFTWATSDKILITCMYERA